MQTLVEKKDFSVIKYLPQDLIEKSRAIAETYDVQNIADMGKGTQIRITNLTKPILEKTRMRDLDIGYNAQEGLNKNINKQRVA